MKKKQAASTKSRYANLKKPSRAPPAWLFGPVWTVLYILIFISFGSVFLKSWNHALTFMVLFPFILNLLFNLIFSPIEFKLKNNMLAAMDIVLIRGTIIWAMIVIYPYAHRITYMQIPYLIWVSIATVLQLTVTYMNKKK
ncbi:MAG: tryptophan-rich sensory protein [candidate division SR1 bacterium]|nr:tryptophan-rich sensory protein [candidate division SR1 bacterium]